MFLRPQIIGLTRWVIPDEQKAIRREIINIGLWVKFWVVVVYSELVYYKPDK